MNYLILNCREVLEFHFLTEMSTRIVIICIQYDSVDLESKIVILWGVEFCGAYTRMGLEYFRLKKLDWGLTNSGGVRRFPVQKSLKSISSQLFEFSENFRCIKSTNYTHLFKAKRILYYIFVNDT